MATTMPASCKTPADRGAEPAHATGDKGDSLSRHGVLLALKFIQSTRRSQRPIDVYQACGAPRHMLKVNGHHACQNDIQAPVQVSLISNTGHVDCRTKRSATLPITMRRMPRRPCVPITTRSARN